MRLVPTGRPLEPGSQAVAMGPRSAYYEHQPQVDLDRHLAVIGWFTDFTRAVAFRTASVLGLPCSDLDRLVEHETGQDLGRLVQLQGEPAYRAVEHRCLAQAVRQGPPGILALGDGALIDARNLRTVAEDCRLVVLELDLAGLFWRLQTWCRQRGARNWHPLFDGLPEAIDELRPFFQQRQSSFAHAHKRLDVRGLTPRQVSSRLQSWIAREGVGG